MANKNLLSQPEVNLGSSHKVTQHLFQYVHALRAPLHYLIVQLTNVFLFPKRSAQHHEKLSALVAAFVAEIKAILAQHIKWIPKFILLYFCESLTFNKQFCFCEWNTKRIREFHLYSES